MDLGATEWVTFRKITLPMIAPGVAAAAMLAAAISFDDYVITSFNAGQTQTFPLFIFGATRQGVPAEVNVLATMLLIAVLGPDGPQRAGPEVAGAARPHPHRRLIRARVKRRPVCGRAAARAERLARLDVEAVEAGGSTVSSTVSPTATGGAGLGDDA